MIAIGRIMPSSKPRCGRRVNPTAACSDGVTNVPTSNLLCWGGVPNVVVPVKVSGFRAYEVTRPNEMSPCPRIAEELTVMNPFESIAGRNISRSTGAFWSWARAVARKPVATTAKTAAWIKRRLGRTNMNTSGRTGATTSGPTELPPIQRRPFITASRSESKRYPARSDGSPRNRNSAAAGRRRRAADAPRGRGGRRRHPPGRRVRPRGRGRGAPGGIRAAPRTGGPHADAAPARAGPGSGKTAAASLGDGPRRARGGDRSGGGWSFGGRLVRSARRAPRFRRGAAGGERRRAGAGIRPSRPGDGRSGRLATGRRAGGAARARAGRDGCLPLVAGTTAAGLRAGGHPAGAGRGGDALAGAEPARGGRPLRDVRRLDAGCGVGSGASVGAGGSGPDLGRRAVSVAGGRLPSHDRKRRRRSRRRLPVGPRRARRPSRRHRRAGRRPARCHRRRRRDRHRSRRRRGERRSGVDRVGESEL